MIDVTELPTEMLECHRAFVVLATHNAIRNHTTD
jgi:hypothetical protein